MRSTSSAQRPFLRSTTPDSSHSAKKKELKARIAALEEERAVLEKSRAAMTQIDDARKKLAAAKENAENEYKQRGLL